MRATTPDGATAVEVTGAAVHRFQGTTKVGVSGRGQQEINNGWTVVSTGYDKRGKPIARAWVVQRSLLRDQVADEVLKVTTMRRRSRGR